MNHHKVFKTKRTVTRTFRIKYEWDDVLKKEAERQGVSVNVLVNNILQRYVYFDRLAQGNNVICLTKPAFREILDGIMAERLALAGENTGSKDLQNILGMLGLSSNYDSFAHLVLKHFGGPKCAMWFCCYRHLHENRDVFHLQHDLGRKWSIYLQKYFLSYLNTLKIASETKVYDYALSIRVPRVR